MSMKDQELWANLFYYIREGFPNHAIRLAEDALRKCSNDLALKLYIALALGYEGRLQESIKRLLELKDNEEFSLAAYLSLVIMHKRSKNIDQDSIKDFETKIREIRRHASDMTLYYAALSLFCCQKYDKAKDYGEKALKANLLSRETLSLNGWIDLMGKDEGMQKKAIRYFEEPTNDEETMSLECLMGKVKYFQVCNTVQASLDALNIVIVNFPTYLPALIEKMKLQLTSQDWEQAIDTAQRCVNMETTCIEAIKFQVLYNLCKVGDYSEARKKLEDLSNAIETTEPNYPQLYQKTSSLFSTLCGRDAVALQTISQLAEKAITMMPSDPRYAINMGRILLLQGRPKEATRYFKMTLEASDSSVIGLQGIIQCQLTQGLLSEAGTQLEFLKELQPTIGKSAELSFLAAVLARKQGAPVQQILALLDEAFELHSKRFQGLQVSWEYYEALNVDFLVQIVNEYLHAAPQQPPASMWLMSGGARHQDDPILMRCLRVLEPIISSAPGCQIAVYLQANVYYLLGDPIAALNSVKTCLELDPTLVEGHILLAQIYLYQANLKLAERALETGLSNNFEVRNHPLYQLVRARLLIRQGSAKVAVQILKQSIASLSGSGTTSAAAGSGRQVSSKRPALPVSEDRWFGTKTLSASERLTLYLELVEAHKTLNEWHEATKVLQDAQIAFAGTTEIGRVTVASAELALAQGDHEVALTTLRNIRPEHPYYIQARQHMANIYLQHRKEKKLYAACYRELAEKLNTTEAHLLMGDAYMTIQEPERAIEVYEAVLRKNPNDLRLATKMGEALVQTHNYAKAVSYYEAAVKGGQTALQLDLIDLLIKLKHLDKAKRLITPLVTTTGADSASEVLDLKEMRRALNSLINLCAADSEQADSHIELLNQAKAAQARRLARVQTGEVGDIVSEQRLAMAEICLQLATIHIVQLRKTIGDRPVSGIRERDRGRDEKADASKGDGPATQPSTGHQSSAIAALQETITQVSLIAGRRSLDTRRPGTLGLVRSAGGGELSRTRRAAVRLEAEALVQLATLYLLLGDHANCEQETMKLAQLEEELEASCKLPMASTALHTTPQTKQSPNKTEPGENIPPEQAQLNANDANLLAGVRPAASIMAELMYAKSDFEAASKHMENVVAKTPTDYHSLAKLIDALRRAGHLQRVPQLLDKAKSMDPLGEASSGLNFCRGLYHRITGEYTLALQYFNQSRIDRDFNEETIYHMVEICLNPDNRLPTDDLTDGLNDGAGFTTTSGHHLSPGNATGSGIRADTGCSVPSALETAEQLLKEIRAPTSTRRYRYMSNMLLLMTGSKPHVTSALEKFAQMAQEEPESGAVIYGAAACYMMLKQTQKARNQLKRLAKVPWNVHEAEELEKAWLLLADIYIQSGKTDLSQELLKRCLQYNKCCTKAYEYTGYIMEREQNFLEAVRNYALAWANSNKQNLAIGYKLAYNHLKVHQLIEAIQVCLHVLEIQPNYPKIRKDILDKARISLRT